MHAHKHLYIVLIFQAKEALNQIHIKIINVQSTPKEALDRVRSRNQQKAQEVKPKQVELALPNLLDILDSLQQDSKELQRQDNGSNI